MTAQRDVRPLVGMTILIARPMTDGILRDRLTALGARVVEIAATRIERLDMAPLADAIDRRASYDWLIFTSRQGVGVFLDALANRGLELDAIANCRIAVVGRSTARALTDYGVPVEVIPATFTAEGLAEALAERPDVAGTRALYPAAEGARDVLPTTLRALGVTVDVLPCYRSVTDLTQRDALAEALDGRRIDLAVVSAPSSARAVLELAADWLADPPRAVTIGPSTSAAAREAGFTIAAEASDASDEGLVDAVLRARAAAP